MPRFIAFYPALFLILPESGFPGAGTYSQQRDTALLFPMSITPRSSQSIPLIRAIRTRSSVCAVAAGHVCSDPVEFVNPSYSANPLLSNPST
jgi:hypothetical protein